MEFVVDKVALGQVFSEFFGFPCQYHSTITPHSYIIWGINNRPAGGHSSRTYSHPIDMNNNILPCLSVYKVQYSEGKKHPKLGVQRIDGRLRIFLEVDSLEKCCYSIIN
jgi:hypothetical protein